MNGDTIKEFLVGLGFQVDDASLASFNAGIANASVKALALGAAVTAAAGAVFFAVNQMAGELDDLAELAERVDSTAEAVDRLGKAAELNDSSVDAARASLEGLNRTAGQAANGLGRGMKWFEKLGISVKDANGKLKNTDALLAEVGAAVKGLSSGEQAAALEGLGIDRTMLKTITGGLAEVSGQIDAMYAAAGVNINEAAESAGAFKDELSALNFTLGAMGKGILVKFMGPITEGMARMRKTLMENMPRIIRVVTPIIDIIMRIAGAFLALAARVASAVGVVIDWIMDIQDATNGWAGIILAVVAAWKYLNLAFLASPVGMIIALAAAIALLVEDFMTWQEGGDSLIDWSAWAPGIDAAIGAVTILRDILGGFFTMMFASIDMLVKVLTGDFAGAFRAAGEYIDAFLGMGAKAWELIKGLGGALGIGDGKLPSVGMDKPALTPSAAAAATATGGANQTVSQQTQIVVQAGPNADATAKAVAGQQRGVNSDMARNMKGAAR